MIRPSTKCCRGEKGNPEGTVAPTTTNSLLLSSPSMATKMRGIGGGRAWNEMRPRTAGREAPRKPLELLPVPVRSRQEQEASTEIPMDAFVGKFNSISFQEQGIATGPPPELWADLPKTVESARPGTRRSRMRSRAGNSTSDEGNMSAPAGFLEVDHLSNIPITVTSDNSTVNVTAAFPKQPSIQQQHCSHQTVHQQKLRHGQVQHVVPRVPKPSTINGVNGGRRGRHLVDVKNPSTVNPPSGIKNL